MRQSLNQIDPMRRPSRLITAMLCQGSQGSMRAPSSTNSCGSGAPEDTNAFTPLA